MKKILEQMILDVEESEISFYKASDVLWDELSKKFQKIIRSNGIKNVQAQDEFNHLFSYVLPYGNLQTEIPMWLYYNFLKKNDTFGILEKTSTLLSEKYDFDASNTIGRTTKEDKVLNWDYLISIDTIQTLASINPSILTDSLKICEIGAGWGRVGYYLTQVNKNISYHIFDIPHVLYVSHEYLRNCVEHIAVYDYEESKKFLKSQDSKPGIFFHTPHFLENLERKTFDLTINIASFQEMNYDQVNSYFGKINDLSKMLYTQQRYSDLNMNYEKYPRLENWEKVLDKDVNFHPLWFEQFFVIE